MTAETDPGAEARPTDIGSARRLNPGVMGHRLAFRLRGLLSLLGDRVVAGFSPYGLRSGSYTTMALMAANPGCSQVDLAREGVLDKSSLVAIVDDLEKRGLAIRARSPLDRRRSSLFLTPEGEAMVKDMYAAAMATEKSIRDALGADKMAQLFALLDDAYAVIAREDFA